MRRIGNTKVTENWYSVAHRLLHPYDNGRTAVSQRERRYYIGIATVHFFAGAPPMLYRSITVRSRCSTYINEDIPLYCMHTNLYRRSSVAKLFADVLTMS
jgi:hypothetical protein